MRITLQQEEIMDILTEYMIEKLGLPDDQNMRDSGFFNVELNQKEVEDFDNVIFSIQTPVIDQ